MPIQSDNQPNIFTWEEFKGLNQNDRRHSINDQEEWWDENLFQLSDGNLRTLWGPSDPIYQAPQGLTILRIFFGFYGNDGVPFGQPDYTQPPPGRMGWMWLSDGSIDEVDLDTHNVTRIGGGRQIWVPIIDPNGEPKYWGDTVVWRPRWVGGVAGERGGVLFGSPGGRTPGAPGGLWAWDGQNLYGPGDPAPNWLSNADIGAGGPAWDGLMPVELPGIYALEVYMERLWVAGRDVISFSAPDNGADFTDADGGGTFAYFGNKLVHDWMYMYALRGFLFLYGDSSIDQVSNVQMTTAATQALTFFNHQNVDPQNGQRWPRPIGKFNTFMLLYNGAGIYFQTGADLTPVGDKIRSMYEKLDAGEFFPTAATATIHNKKVILFNFKTTDPFGVTRPLIFVWHETFWSVASQWWQPTSNPNGATPTQIDLTNIGYYEDNSVCTPYGTDGTYLFRLFDHPNPIMPKRFSSKAFSDSKGKKIIIKNFKRLYAEIHDDSGQGVNINGVFTTQGGGIPNGSEEVSFELVPGKVYDIIPWPLAGSGISGALDIHSLSPDFTIERIHLTFEERTLFGA